MSLSSLLMVGLSGFVTLSPGGHPNTRTPGDALRSTRPTTKTGSEAQRALRSLSERVFDVDLGSGVRLAPNELVFSRGEGTSEERDREFRVVWRFDRPRAALEVDL